MSIDASFDVLCAKARGVGHGLQKQGQQGQTLVEGGYVRAMKPLASREPRVLHGFMMLYEVFRCFLVSLGLRRGSCSIFRLRRSPPQRPFSSG